MDTSSEHDNENIFYVIWFNLQLRLFAIVGILFVIAFILGLVNLYIWYLKKFKRVPSLGASSSREKKDTSNSNNPHSTVTRTNLLNKPRHGSSNPKK